MDRVLIGCPVYKREWILPAWLGYIEEQTWPLDRIGFIFEGAPNDVETRSILFDWHSSHPEIACFDYQENSEENHQVHGERFHQWNMGRYHAMARFRNNLLRQARAHAYERYFSLDSDILLTDPETIEQLFELTKTRHAVSPICYMKPDDQNFPNTMSWVKDPGGPAKRMVDKYPKHEVFGADVIMAAVMMTPPVYEETMYRPHPQGEDLGWSYEAWKGGFKLWLAPELHCDHIMYKWHLDEFNKRVLT